MSSISSYKLKDEMFLPIQLLPAKKKSFFDLANPSLILIIWDIILGLPFSYALTVASQHGMRWLGYESLMRCSSGIMGSRVLFMAVHLWIVWSWAVRLRVEAEERGESKRIDEQIKMLDREIERLKTLLAVLEATELEEQFKNDNRDVEESVIMIDRRAWIKSNKTRISVSPNAKKQPSF